MSTQGEFFEKPDSLRLTNQTAGDDRSIAVAETAIAHAPREHKRGMKDLSIPKLYYSISEVSRLTGLEQYVLRYWETEFDELRPQKNRAGNRIYSNKDIQFILKIKDLLREQRYTIEGAKHILRDDRNSEKEKLAKSATSSDDSVLIDESPSAQDPNQISLPATSQVESSTPRSLSVSLTELAEIKEALLTLKSILGRRSA